MTCNHCVRHVEEELTGVAGVERVLVSLEAGEVTVTHEPTTPKSELVSAVEEAGYSAS